ncbi:MFS transporter [Microbulbifer marinus]|uniref:Sugar phosphate permease n=1 Tax=Microbulbifer marinus TaxID=658218 RepID=A0A1H4A1L0_9GAMM|nr:MFS transporter [Microbulbifer marinus]SEA29856.1 Sugar phosphate permease [Microbulbifer marinus]
MTITTSLESVTSAGGSQRWRLTAVLMVTVFVAYLDRMNISLALPLMAEEFAWNLEQKQFYGSLLMSLFYVAYGLSNLLMTPLAARLGPRSSLLAIALLWSLFTALGAFFSQFVLLLCASRVLLGLSEGVHFPMASALVQRWFPLHERSRANSIWIAGLFLAILSGPLLLVPLMHLFGWRAGFYCLAIGGLALSLPLIRRWVYDTPAAHPRLNASERSYLEQHLPPAGPAAPLDWGQLRDLVTPAFGLMMLVGILNNMASLGIASWLPTYLASKEGVDYRDLSYLAALPYVFSFAGMACWAHLGDHANNRGALAASGFTIAGIAVYCAFRAEPLWLVMTLMSFSVFFISAYNACEFAMVQRLLPAECAAEGTGVYNGLSTMVGGGLGTALMGQLMADGSSTIDAWPVLLLFLAAAIAIGTLGRICRY